MIQLLLKLIESLVAGAGVAALLYAGLIQTPLWPPYAFGVALATMAFVTIVSMIVERG